MTGGGPARTVRPNPTTHPRIGLANARPADPKPRVSRNDRYDPRQTNRRPGNRRLDRPRPPRPPPLRPRRPPDPRGHRRIPKPRLPPPPRRRPMPLHPHLLLVRTRIDPQTRLPHRRCEDLMASPPLRPLDKAGDERSSVGVAATTV